MSVGTPIPSRPEAISPASDSLAAGASTTAALAVAASASLVPAISMPSSSAGTSGGRNPVIRPSYMTAIRSDSA